MKILSPILNNITNKSGADSEARSIKPKNNSSHLHLDPKGVIKNVSEEFCHLTGYNKKNLKGKNISTLIFKTRKSAVAVLLKELSADNPFVQTKLKLVAADNTPIYTELYLTLTSLKKNAPIFAIFRKSGTHQEKYSHLFEKKEKLRILSENTKEVQVLFDSDLNSLYISPSCKSLLGYDYTELLDKDLYNYVCYDDLDKIWESFRVATVKGQTVVVFRALHKEGYYLYVEALTKVIKDEFNSITNYALYLHDASERIKTEQQLLRSQKAAESANRLKNHFLASVSHEFRTPLNAIIGFSKIIQKSYEEEPLNTYQHNIEVSGMQLLDMVNNLLNFSQIEKSELSPNITPFHINKFFRNLKKSITQRFLPQNYPNIEIKCSVENEECTKIIFSDRSIFAMIFENLIANAIKFTKDGYVKFGCKPYGFENLLFYVEDSGIGIKKEFHDKIFDKLTQQDGSLTKQHNGIGIGLSVTKKMIDLLDGDIWVISEEGAGAAFYFTLPRRAFKSC